MHDTHVGSSLLHQAGQLPLLDGSQLTFAQFCSDPRNQHIIDSKSKSSKRNDLFVYYCKSLKALDNLRFCMEQHGYRPDTKLPVPAPSVGKSKHKHVVSIAPDSLTNVPSVLDTSTRFASTRLSSPLQFLFNWPHWGLFVKCLSWLLTAFTVLQPQAAVRLSIWWVKECITCLLSESTGAIGSLFKALSTPLAESTKFVSQQVNYTVPDHTIDSFSIACVSFLVAIVGTRLPGNHILHCAFPARIPIDVD